MTRRVQGWGLPLGISLLLWALIIASCNAALGHGYNYSPDENAWFNRQLAIDGTKCCDESDAHVGENVDWRMVGGHYEVYILDGWHRVPPERVMRSNPDDPSPFGSAALLFWSPAPHTTRGFMLWCFRPGVVL
jgi:hypothetical protein